MSVSGVQRNGEAVRILAAVVTGILLNLGLFLFLYIFAPLAAGFSGGYFFSRYRIGIPSGALSAAVAYSIFFMTISPTTDFLTMVSAVLIMTTLGATGGLIGVFLRSRAALRMN